VKTYSCYDRLFAGGARIHVDFHADRHFYDLWGLPGHFGSPCLRTGRTPRSALKLVSNENFASEIFCPKGRRILCCGAKEIGLISALTSNRSGINGFAVPLEYAIAHGPSPPSRERQIKNL
jgi:hypothetical protein